VADLLALFRRSVPYFKGTSDADVAQAVGLAWAERPACLTPAKQDEAQILYAAWTLYQQGMQANYGGGPIGVRSEKEGDLARTYGAVEGSDDPFGWLKRYNAFARACAGSITVGHRWRDSCCGLGFPTDPAWPTPEPTEPLALDGTPVTSGTAGQPYDGFTVTASGGFAPYGYFIVAGPPGMTVNAAGVVAWPVMADGSHAVTVRAVDSHGDVADLLFVLEVTATGLARPVNTVRPTIVGLFRVGETVTVNVGDWTNDPDSYAIQWLRGGQVIPGATEWTYQYSLADVNIRSTVRVVAINEAGPSDPATSLPSDPVAIAVPDLQIAGVPPLAVVGEPYAWAPEITGGRAPYVLTGGPLPAGLAPSGATIAGTPTSDDDVIGTVLTVTDADGRTATLGPFPFPVDQPGQDTSPRFGPGPAEPSDLAALFASMAPYDGSFTGSASAGQYLWVAHTSPALAFQSAQGTGGWQGAGYAGENFDDQNVSPNTTELTATIDGVVWWFYRMNFPNGSATWTTQNG
jgi:hypothetical protein